MEKLSSIGMSILALAAVFLASPAASGEVAIPERVYRDIDRKPLPFESDGEIEAFLRSAAVTSQREIGTGVTKPKQLVLEKDGLKVHAAFNYVDLAGTKEKMKDKTVEMFFLDSYRADIATYRLSRLLGLEMIPPGVERRIDGVDGVVRLWVEDLESVYVALDQRHRYRTVDHIDRVASRADIPVAVHEVEDLEGVLGATPSPDR